MENIWNVNVFCCLLEQSNARQFIWLQNSRIMRHKLETAAEYYEQWPPALMEQPAECRWNYLELFGVIIHYTLLYNRWPPDMEQPVSDINTIWIQNNMAHFSQPPPSK